MQPVRFSIGSLAILSLLTQAALAAGASWDPSISQAIDRQIEAVIKAEGLQSAPRATDSELVRRIYLDILGRIPTAEEAARFLDDDSPDKHHALIDELLAHDEMPVYWRLVFDEWLNGDLRDENYGRDRFLDYLEQALKNNRPWDEMARDLLTPNIDDEVERGAAFFLSARLRGGDKQEKIDSMTTAVASSLFGVQLQCAKCHDHPYVTEWQQDHYYGLAAFLGRTQETKYKDSPFLKERADGEVTFVTTDREEKTARLMFLDGHVVEEPQLPEDREKWYAKGSGGKPDVPMFSRREALVDYAISADRPSFKRAIVNRMWKQLMGRGLIEPVDQMHAANPPTHPKLLELLSEDFAAHGFDLRRLMAGLLHSETYLRSSKWTASAERPGDSLYATAIMKPLSPDQLAQSFAMASGYMDVMHAKYEREKKKRKLDKVTLGVVRKLLAGDRDYRTIVQRFAHRGESFEANASQALFLTYNKIMEEQFEASRGTLAEQLTELKDNADVAERAYLRVLSRHPSKAEVAEITEYLSAANPSRRELIRDVVWALCCSAEFRFNH